uniref:Uncharacterized protein n=1 Tax=Nothobranchius furzeri TaxID=105023 RepID=A0A1A7ZEZ5_NOTFU
MCTYYNIVITWALYYLFSSFQAPLPWQSCNNTWNTPNCTNHATNSSYSSTASQEFFKYRMLEQTSGVEEAGMLRYNSFNNNVLKDTLSIAIINSVTSILAGFVIFSAFGYMSHLQGIPVSKLAVDGPGLVFVVYPQAFANMPVSQLWAVMFFFMLLCLGLDSEFAMVEVMVTSLMDEFYQHLIKVFKRKEFFVLAICGVTLLLGIPCVMQVGIYVFQLMDHYTAIVSIMFLAFFEIIAICWSYGVKRLTSNLEEMTGSKPNIFFRFCWLVVDPVLITVILIFSIIQFKPARYEDYVFPPWAQGVGWIIALASIIWIPLGTIHTLWVLPGSFMQRLKLSITPFTLNDKSKTPYYERGGAVEQPSIAVTTSNTSLPEKPIETNF